jgi:hypothetical protein
VGWPKNYSSTTSDSSADAEGEMHIACLARSLARASIDASSHCSEFETSALMRREC